MEGGGDEPITEGASGASPPEFKLSLNSPPPPRKPSPYLVFMEMFLEPYVKEKRCKDKTLAAAVRATGFNWDFLSDRERAPYCLEAENRMVVYDKDMKAYREKYGKSDKPPPSKGEADKSSPSKGETDKASTSKGESQPSEDEEDYQILSPFGIFMESEFFFTNKLVASIDENLAKWQSMSVAEKSPYVRLAAKRMAMHEKNAIAYYVVILDKLLTVAEESEGSEGSEGVKASSGLLVFLEEFLGTYENAGKTPDTTKPASVLISEMLAKWQVMTEKEKGPYIAEAEKLMVEYDEQIVSCFQSQENGQDDD